MIGNPRYPKSDHFDGKRFFNPWGVNANKSLWEVLNWKLKGEAKAWPTPPVPNTATARLLTSAPTQAPSSRPIHITSIGHATVLIQDQNLNILTDPQLSDRASPVSFAGPSRIRKPGLTLDELPQIHYVVVSHNHYDHLDLPTLVALHKKFKPVFVVPLGNGSLLRDAGVTSVVELDWWQSHHEITLVPVQHWSARGVMDRNEALWGGFVISLAQKKIFFAGDTGYGPHFKMIREKMGPMDISLLPIGAYEPRWFMKDQHMNPEDAVQAHLDLESRQSVAIHFETFQMTDEAFDEPRKALSDSIERRSTRMPPFTAPQIGGTEIFH